MAANSLLVACLLAFCQVTVTLCAVSPAWINQTLSQHFSQARHHVTNPGYKAETMRFIRDQFRDMGLETHLHNFSTDLSNVTGVNVVGVLKGRLFDTPGDRVAGIGAHYDTMRDTPGVDDNGAAVAVMLAAARELSQQTAPRNFTLIFIAFDFEEWEEPNEPQVACSKISCGSRSLVTDWIPIFWTQPVDAAWAGIYVMDTIMNFNSNQSSQHFPAGIGQVFPAQINSIQSYQSRGDFLMLTGRVPDTALVQAFNQSWGNQGQRQFELEVFPLNAQTENIEAFDRSDHTSFWDKGLAAAFISDTANYRGYMTACYHHECDKMQRVTPAMIDFAAKTCRTLIGALNTMGGVETGDNTASKSDGQRSNSALTASIAVLAMSLGYHGNWLK